MTATDTPAAAIRRRGLLLVLSSPSGAGKTTITRRLLERDPTLSLSVSVTTRPPRPGEIDGCDYVFIDEAQFARMVAAGELLEHATVFGNSYGTPRRPIETALAAGRDTVTDIDWQGTQQLSKRLPADLVRVFILPPSVPELEARLRRRGLDNNDVVKHRMEQALEEMSHWSEYDYVIINRDVDQSVEDAQAILAAERMKRNRQLSLPEVITRPQVSIEAPTGPDVDAPGPSRRRRRRSRRNMEIEGVCQELTTGVIIHPTIYAGGLNGPVVIVNSIEIKIDSSEFQILNRQVTEILEHLRQSNELSSDVQRHLSTEVRAGMELIKTGRTSQEILDVFLLRPLRFIAKEFSAADIRALASAAASTLARWLGVG